MSDSSQTARLADQIRRAFEGEAWHGDPLLTILKDVRGAAAAAKPIKNAHSMWEILLHLSVWDGIVVRRIAGQVVNPTPAEDFPPIPDTSEAAWKKTIEQCKKTHDELVKAVAAFPDSRLQEGVPGKEKQPYYDYFFMFAGIVQHELYHAGQIVMLKKMS